MTAYVRLGVLLLALHGCSNSSNNPATQGGSEGDPASGQPSDTPPCERICAHISDLCGPGFADCVASCASELSTAEGQCVLAAAECGALSECETAEQEEGDGSDHDVPCTGNACPSQSDCNGVDCGGHGDCQIVAGTATCFCDEGYVLEQQASLTCVKSDGDGSGYRFDADSDTAAARSFLKQIAGEWFPERPAWTSNASDISLGGYLFQYDGPSGRATFYSPDLTSVSIRKTYDRRLTPDYVVSKVSKPLTGAGFDGYRALELKSTKPGTSTVDTLLIKIERVQQSGNAEHPVLEVAACPSPYNEGVARPLLKECLDEASASAYVPSILGASAYKTMAP